MKPHALDTFFLFSVLALAACGAGDIGGEDDPTGAAEDAVTSAKSLGDIADAGKRVAVFAQANGRLPNYVTIGANQATMASLLEIAASAILEINAGKASSLTLKSFGAAAAPSDNTAPGKIPLSELLRIAHDVKTSMDSSGKAPNYVASTSLGTHLGFTNLVYMFSKALDFYGANQRLPNYVTLDLFSHGATCTPTCSGKACGDNGCGGSCGTCSGGRTCNSSGACIASGFIRGLYIQTGSYWNGSRIVLTSANLAAMEQAGITDVYAQVHFADTSSNGYAASLKPVVQFFKGSGIRVHAWTTPSNYNPADNGPSSINQKVINGVTDIYANNYGVDGVVLDEFYYPGTAASHSNATQYVTDFHKRVFSIVRAHGGIATTCTTPEYGVAASVYGVDYAGIGQVSDYVTPMAYVGDFASGNAAYVGKVVAAIQAKTSARVFPALESYVSDQNPTPKSVAQLNDEVTSATSAGADGYALFRFGLLSGYPTAHAPAP